MFGVADFICVDVKLPIATELAAHRRQGNPLNRAVVAPPIGNQIGDRPNFQFVFLGEFYQVFAARHGAVIIHDLADHTSRIKTRQARNINRRLGVARANQHTAIARHQRKNMSRRRNISSSFRRINGHCHGARPVWRRNACRHAFARFDRYRESSSEAAGVLLRQQRQAKLVDPLLRHGEAYEAAAVLCHEVNRLRRRHLRRYYQIAFVFTVLIIDKNEHLAVSSVLDNLLGGRFVLFKAHL